RSGRREQEFGGGRGGRVGRAAAARAEGLHEEAQEPGGDAAWQVVQHFGQTKLDGGEARLHRVGEEREVGLLAAFVFPSFERGGEKIQLREDVAEAFGQHLAPLERAAEGEQRDVGGEGEGRRIARDLPIV